MPLMMIRLRSMKLVLLIRMIYGRLTGEGIKTVVKKVLKTKDLEYKIINPLFGYMFRANGCAENMRLYSPKLKIKYDNNVERIYKKDKSNNSLTNLLIQLFPSHTGVLNNFRGTDLNFTNKYFIENVAWYDENKKDRIANIRMLGNMFAGLVKKQNNDKITIVGKKTEYPYKLIEYYLLLPSDVPGLDNKIQKLLTIHAYAVETFDTPDELGIYLNSIIENLEGAESAIIHVELTKEQKQLFECLYINPHKFPYSKINQPASNSSIPIYDRKNDTYDKDKKFPDCVDIVILHLCNCLFYNELTGECSLDHLKLAEPDRLKKFYEDYSYRPFEITHEIRNAWSRVVQGLEDNEEFECQGNYKPYMIHYVDQKYRNEIRSGLFNVMSVLAKVSGIYDAYKEILTKKGTISKDSVVEKLTEFFKKICNKNIKITIEGKDIEEIDYNNVSDFIGDFSITFDLANSDTSITMRLEIKDKHISFFFEDMESKQKKIDFTALENLNSKNNYIFSSLISRYIKLLNNEDAKTNNFRHSFEVLYNQGVLKTNEQKRDQCIHLCEYMDKIEEEEHTAVKKMIENIVKSANLSDPATRAILRPFFIYVDDIFGKMSNCEVLETWMSFFNKESNIGLQNIRNTWNEAAKKSFMKIKGIGFSGPYTNVIADVKTILSATKDTLEDLKLTDLTLDPQKFTQIIQEFLADVKVLKALAIPKNRLSSTHILGILDLLKNSESFKTLDIQCSPKVVQCFVSKKQVINYA